LQPAQEVAVALAAALRPAVWAAGLGRQTLQRLLTFDTRFQVGLDTLRLAAAQFVGQQSPQKVGGRTVNHDVSYQRRSQRMGVAGYKYHAANRAKLTSHPA